MKALLLLLLVNAEPVRLSLQDALARIDQFDPALRVQALNQTRAEITERRAKWNQVSGSVGLNAQYYISETGILPLRNTQPVSPTFSHSLNMNLTAQIVYPLYAGGAIANAIDAAEQRHSASKQDVAATRRDLRRAAIAAYAQVVASHHQTKISEHSLERSANLVDLATRRRVSGLGTDADIARAKLNLLRATEDVETRRGGENIAAAILAAVLMYDSGTQFELVDSLEQLGSHGAGDAADRPEVLSLRYQVTAAEHDRKAAFGGYLPRLDLFANFTYGNGQIFFVNGVPLGGNATDVLGAFGGNFVGGARLTWTGWDFFVTRDAVAQAEAVRVQLESRLVDMERITRRERDEALARENQSKKRVEALAGGRDTAEQAVKLARARYEAGTAILTEVLDAEIEAIGIESRVVQANLDYAVAHADRLRAEGREL